MNLNSIFFLIIYLVSSVAVANASGIDTIRVATFIEPPVVNYKNSQYSGENIDVARLLAKKLGKKIKFIQCPIARCLSMMKEGDADLIFSLRKTVERQQYMTFIEPAFKVQHYPLRFFTLKGSKLKIERFTDLDKLVVGAIRGAAYYEEFDNNNELNKIFVTEHAQLIQMLLKNRIDTFLEREETIKPLITNETYLNSLALAKYKYDKAVYSYIAVSKNSPLHGIVNRISMQIIDMIKSGELAVLVESSKVPKLSDVN